MKFGGLFMNLKPLTLENLEEVREWRNMNVSILRNSTLLTKEMQQNFYYDVVNNKKNTTSRHFAFQVNGMFVGMGSLVNIDWENSLAEIGITYNGLRDSSFKNFIIPSFTSE